MDADYSIGHTTGNGLLHLICLEDMVCRGVGGGQDSCRTCTREGGLHSQLANTCVCSVFIDAQRICCTVLVSGGGV